VADEAAACGIAQNINRPSVARTRVGCCRFHELNMAFELAKANSNLDWSSALGRVNCGFQHEASDRTVPAPPFMNYSRSIGLCPQPYSSFARWCAAV
jgi:hypothetical protein